MSYCGADCSQCAYFKDSSCRGCEASSGSPFGKKCFIAGYVELGGREAYDKFKKQLIADINALGIEGLPEIKELFELNGSYVNLAYPLASGEAVKFLDDRDVYLGTQVECPFVGRDSDRCVGIVANSSFILVCEYGENGSDPELLLYKKR